MKLDNGLFQADWLVTGQFEKLRFLNDSVEQTLKMQGKLNLQMSRTNHLQGIEVLHQ